MAAQQAGTSPAPQCSSCASTNLVRLDSEVCLHLSGLSGLEATPLFIYPKLAICSDCGFMQSVLSPADLRLIKENLLRH